MAELKKRKLKQQMQNDAYSKHRSSAIQKNLSKQNFDDDDDDSGGGGLGKRRKNGFKLEGLLKAIEKGKEKAQGFWRFLAKEGLDVHDTKKSELNKQREKTEKAADTHQSNERSEQSREKSQEIQSERDSGSGDDYQPSESQADSAWEKAKAVDSSKAHQFGLEGAKASDSAGRSGSRSESSAGIAKQIDLGGIFDSQSAQQSSQDVQGGRVQGAIHAKHFDHVGSQQFNHAGKDFNQFAFSQGARQGGSQAQTRTTAGRAAGQGTFAASNNSQSTKAATNNIAPATDHRTMAAHSKR